jgi:hypothetical protein
MPSHSLSRRRVLPLSNRSVAPIRTDARRCRGGYRRPCARTMSDWRDYTLRVSQSARQHAFSARILERLPAVLHVRPALALHAAVDRHVVRRALEDRVADADQHYGACARRGDGSAEWRKQSLRSRAPSSASSRRYARTPSTHRGLAKARPLGTITGGSEATGDAGRRRMMVPRVGFEPTAYRLRSGCSTAELSGQWPRFLGETSHRRKPRRRLRPSLRRHVPGQYPVSLDPPAALPIAA